ncbi:GFA family protein [Streptomyces bobili]|uniref:GFA family protein n=1 Tax=Streptomyces bobili TaxID=67280 RepID=UPI003F53F093
MNATPADVKGAETAGERTGGCLCGRIRFTTRGPAIFPHTCVCRHCQKLGGTPVLGCRCRSPRDGCRRSGRSRASPRLGQVGPISVPSRP